MQLTLGNKIKQLRKEKRLTQGELAGEGLSRTMLSKLENDLAKPSLKTIEYLASKLSVPVAYFTDEDTHQHPSTFDKQLVHISRMLNKSEYESIYTFIEETLSQHEPDGSEAEGVLLLFFSIACQNTGRMKESYRYLLEAKTILEQNNSFYYLAKVHHHLAICFFDRGDHENDEEHSFLAIQYLNQSLIVDTIMEMNCYYNLAYARMLRGKYGAAILALEEALEIEKERKTHSRTADIYMLLGYLFEKSNDHNKSIDASREASRYYGFEGNRKMQFRSLGNLANVFTKTKQYAKAVPIYKAIFNYELNHGTEQSISESANELVLCMYMNNPEDDPTPYYSRVIPSLLSERDQQFSSFGQAWLHFQNGQFADAITILEPFLHYDENHLQYIGGKLLTACYSSAENYKKAFEVLSMIDSL